MHFDLVRGETGVQAFEAKRRAFIGQADEGARVVHEKRQLQNLDLISRKVAALAEPLGDHMRAVQVGCRMDQANWIKFRQNRYPRIYDGSRLLLRPRFKAVSLS